MKCFIETQSAYHRTDIPHHKDEVWKVQLALVYRGFHERTPCKTLNIHPGT